MKRQTVKRLMTKGIMAYIAVFALVLMVAMPAMALIAARNSVNRRSIIDGEVTYKDIGKGQVRTSEIGPKAVRHGKIADGAVRNRHIRNGAVTAAKINRVGLNADLLDGLDGTAFSAAGHNHDTLYSALVHDHDTSYYTKAESDLNFAAQDHLHEPNLQRIALLKWDGVNQADTSFTVGTNPYAVAFDGANIWVTNNGSDTVTKLNAATGAFIGNYSVGTGPFGATFDGANIWVANWYSNTISKL